MTTQSKELRTPEQIHNDHRSLSEKLEARANAIARAYVHVFGGKEGQLVLDDLKAFSRLGCSSFSESHPYMAYCEGEKETVRYILREIERGKEG